MKKVLLTTAALGLGLALTATVASAATFSAGGKANITGIYLNHGDASSAGFKAGLVDDGTDENVDGWHQSFYFYPKVMINDQTSIQGELRFIDRQVFGDSTSNDASEMMKVYKLWANWNAPFGTVSFGRMPCGTWGSKFLDSTGTCDRIKVSSAMNGVSWALIYQKNEENDTYSGWTDEGDAASYYAGVGFGNDMGKTDIAVWHTISDENNYPNNDYSNTEFWFNGAYNFGAIGLGIEAKYAMGDDPSNSDVDVSSFAAMVNVNTNIDTMTVGFLGFYGQGDDDPTDGDNNGYTTRKGFGNDFNPFVIATGDYFGILNGDKNSYHSAIDFNAGANNGDGMNPGAIAAALYAVMPINDQLTVNAAVGHIWAAATDIAGQDFDNKLGFEVDLGMSYKLVDNLTYSLSIAYMKPGTFVEDAVDYLYGDDVNNILALVHSLTMTF